MARRRPHRGPDGIVIVDKPAGWTSHDVVAKSRGLLGTRKVGHGGTLDPDATGVLLLGVGRATRLLRYLLPLDKTYAGEVLLGAETSTLDAAGDITATHDMAGVTWADVEVAADRFRGRIEQIPPMVSALKVDGQRLHELARQGIEVEREARPVTIHQLDLIPPTDGDPMRFGIEVTCSAGTYIRSLAADIGTALGGGAHLGSLRRTAVGPHTLADSVPLEAVAPEVVRPMTEAVAHLASVTVDEATGTDVATGKVLDRGRFDLDDTDDGPWAIIAGEGDRAGQLLAVYEPFRTGTVKPTLVIPAA